MQINGTGTATLAEYGIYTNNRGLPDQLIKDAGSVSVTTTGQRTISGIAQAIGPAWVWVVTALNGTATVSNMAATTWGSALGQGVSALGAGQGQYAFVTGTWTFAAGTLPSTFPSPTPTTNNSPATALTVA
jgi:hypothetical protein